MNFIIKNKLGSDVVIEQNENLALNTSLEENVLYLSKLSHIELYQKDDKIIYGDIVQLNEKDIFQSKGVFYKIRFLGNGLTVESDHNFFLPLYFFQEGEYVYISSSMMFIKRAGLELKKNNRFLVQSLMFYSFLDNVSAYQGVNKLGYGDRLVVTEDVCIDNYKRFYEYFVSFPKSVKDSLKGVTDTFISNSKHYFKDNCIISLTGGFDGRTNVACAHHHNVKYTTTSYGKPDNGDVLNPIFLAKTLEFEYNLFDVNTIALDENLINLFKDVMEISSGVSGIYIMHMINYYIECAKKTDVLITGCLGSEIFASPKGANDEVIPSVLLSFLNENVNVIDDPYIAFMQEELNISKDDINNELKCLQNYFDELPTHLSVNQKLETFLFENVFPNTFGMWEFLGLQFLKVRSPFFDDEFISKIFKTKLSSGYRKFLDGSYLSRIDGQRMYPYIMNRTYPAISRLTSSKFYAPNDILGPMGIFKIAFHKLLNKTAKKKTDKEFSNDNRNIFSIYNYLTQNSEEIKLSSNTIQNSMIAKYKALNIYYKSI